MRATAMGPTVGLAVACAFAACHSSTTARPGATSAVDGASNPPPALPAADAGALAVDLGRPTSMIDAGAGDRVNVAVEAPDEDVAKDRTDGAIDASIAGDDGGPSTSPLAGVGQVELVKSGFVFVEGLRWVPALDALLVSDAYGETIYKLTPPSTFVPFRPMSNGANCMDLDRDGRIVTAEVGAMKEKLKGGVSRRMDDGTWVDAITDYKSIPIGHPNDIVALPDGNLFFSDLGVRRLLRIDPLGTLSYPIATGEDVGMNGLALSPDKKTLYADGNGGMIRAYDVQAGKLNATHAVKGSGDGMCVDQEGNLYVATNPGVQVWNMAAGRSWGLIPLPGLTGPERGTECAFADPDAKTLYMSAVTKLFRVRLARPGIY